MQTSIPRSGNEIIDHHHAQLSRIVGKLTHAWIADMDRAHFQEIANAFVDNLKSHFESEVTIIRAAGFDRWREHDHEHQYIINKINRLLEGEVEDFMFRIIDEAEKTIFEHELMHDQEYWSVIGAPLSDELITWDDALLVNHPEIDEHHKALVSYLNRLYAWATQEQVDHEVILHNLKQLYAFTKMHFEHEEEQFNLKGDTEVDLSRAHVRDHARLLSELRTMIDNYKQQPDSEEPKIIMRDFLRYWLIDHIITLDKPCFENRRITGD